MRLFRKSPTAESILTQATRLLGPAGTEWADAMRAELAALDDPRARRRFALGCVWAALRTRHAAGALLVRAVAVLPLLMALTWSLRLHDESLRLETAGLTLAVAALPPILARAGASWTIRLLRTAALTLVAAQAMLILDGFDTGSNLSDKTRAAPFVAAVLAAHAAGLAGATSRRASRLAGAVTLGAAAATTATVAFLAPSLAAPPLPAHAGWALLCLPAALAVAAPAALRRLRGTRAIVTAALTAVVVAALELGVAVQALLHLTARWVPAAVDARAVPLADRLANSRAGAEDAYLYLLAAGGVAALCLVVANEVRRARPPRTAPSSNK